MPESKSLKVSIITPLYNAGEFLEPCIQSVLDQSYPNWEMIMVDDQSSDDSLQIAKRYAAQDSRIVVDQLPQNEGSGPARNRAIDLASGEIIAFLDSDDLWHPEKLSRHLAEMTRVDAAFSHTSYGYIDEEGKSIRETFHVSAFPVDYNHLLKRTEISCLTAMYDVRKLGKMYMPNLRRKQDYALWLSILKKGFKSYPLDEELAWYRQRKNSATNNKFKLITSHWTFLRQHEKLSVLKSAFYFWSWIYNGLIKYYI